MKDIKLSGMKCIRLQKDISLERLARDLNLLDAKILKTIITPEYLNTIEIRKQKEIDDNLLFILTKYFNTTLDNLINKQEQDNFKHIKVQHLVPEIGEIKKTVCDIPNYFSNSFIINSFNRLNELNNYCATEDCWNDYLESIQDIVEYIETLPKEQIQLIMEDNDYQEYFLNNYINKLKYQEYLDIAELVQCLYFYFLGKGIPQIYIPQLVISLIEMLLRQGLL